MAKPLCEQTVPVTGAGRCLRASIATAFGREGAKVVINYRKSMAAAESLASAIGKHAIALQADIQDASSVRQWCVVG